MMPKPEVAGQCGCGRSPTGKCIGWHALSEEDYQAKSAEYELAKYRESAEELWFSGGSCTGGQPE
jgi:hypothetical protein